MLPSHTTQIIKRLVSFNVCLASISFLLCFAAWAQPRTPQQEPPHDPLGRQTPRGTVLGFLSAARKGDFDVAAQYLNTRLRGQPAAVLANQLYVVLDRRLPPRLTQLSDQPEGSLWNPAEPNQDLVGTIETANGGVEILLERVDRRKAGILWLFSSKTLAAIPELYIEVNSVPVESLVPKFLVETRILGVALIQWLALLVGLPLVYFATVLIDRLLSRSVGHLRRRLNRREPALPNPKILPNPFRLFAVVLVIRWMLSQASVPLLARQFWSSIATVITIAGCVWLVMRLLAWGERLILRRLARRHLSGATPLLRFVRRAFDLIAIFSGVLVGLRYFGVNTTAALAGLGVGGIAIALAAQKTLENVIGGLSLIFDRTVSVGDFLRVSDTVGTVDGIGLRSTRIRTLDRTVLSVPNGQIANASLENFSARDKFWFHHIVGLHCETTAAQIRSVVERVHQLLAHHSRVEDGSCRVRFLRIGTSSLDLEVVAYLFCRDWNDFLEIQQELLLRIMDIVRAAGSRIALPSQTLYLAKATDTDGSVEALPKAHASASGPSANP